MFRSILCIAAPAFIFLACQSGDPTGSAPSDARAKTRPGDGPGQACAQVLVCGADGKTYPDPCAAAAAGVKYDYDLSRCAPRQEPVAGAPIDPPIPVEPVQPADGMVCPAVWEPVCGADGKTYGNDCEAARAHVVAARAGECE